MARTCGAFTHSLGTFRQEEETRVNCFVHKVLLDVDLQASNAGIYRKRILNSVKSLNRTSNADSQIQIRLVLFTGFQKPVKDFTGFQNMKEHVIS